MTSATRYLLVVYVAEERFHGRVPSGYVAEAVDRSPATATEALQRLEAEGLVSYEPYEGVTLTDAGRERAAESYDALRTLSRFFREVLDVPDYEREALAVVDTVSLQVADRIETAVLPDPDQADDEPPAILTPDEE
ncbi:metal-dependent transcriptional regulator [Halobaculum sp. MBLA0147]|uniref:metal-dependent transcriptional regulator n=1 Tax=Halobaculum sp. MBLA0147 TaxID=3079934 RepID=UPI003526506C